MMIPDAMKNSVTIIIGSFIGCLSAIFLYAYSIKTTALQASSEEVAEHQEVVYKALILESYSMFTYFVLVLAIVLGIVSGSKLGIDKLWLKIILGIIITIAFTLGNLVFYKWFF